MRQFIRSIITPAVVATALVAGSARAATLTGTRIDPPFPAGTAYPGFPSYTQVNLTTLGTLDWIRLGEGATAGFSSQTGFNQKSGGTSISGYSQTGLVAADGGSHHFLSYTDGISPVSSTDNANEITTALGFGFSFNVAASATTTRELNIFGAVLGSATGHLTAQLLDGSNQAIGSAYTNDLAVSGGAPAIFRIDFLGNAVGDHLAVSFTQTAGTGNGDRISLSAATLSNSVQAAPAPSAAIGGLLLLGAIGARKVIRARA